MKRYFISLLCYFLFYLIGIVIFFLSGYFVNALSELLCEWAPSVFTVYNPVTDRDAYLRAEMLLGLTSAIITLYTVTHLSTVYDNERYEHMISVTDGFYTVGEGLAIYFPRYIGADIISAVTVPALPSALHLIKLSEDAPKWAVRVLDLAHGLFAVNEAFTELFGLVLGTVTLVLVSLLFRLPAGYLAVRRFRAVWLSDTEG